MKDVTARRAVRWPKFMALACLGAGLFAAGSGGSDRAAGTAGPSAGAAGTSGADRYDSFLSSRPDSDLDLYQVVFDGQAVGDPIAGFQVDRDHVLLPLGQLAELFQFNLQVDPVAGTVKGTLWKPEDAFTLDLHAGMVVSRGIATRLQKGMVEARPDDIYVDAGLLSACWPVRVEFNQRALVVKATSLEESPAKASARRQKADRKLGNIGDKGVVLPRTMTPYRPLEVDSLDLNATAAWSQTEPKHSYTGGIAAAGDLLWMSAYANYQAANDGSHAFIGWLERQDPEGGLLGPLDAKRVAVGDVASPAMSLITLGGMGPGGLISTFQPGREIRNDRRNFTGALPAGWQAELYVNGLLQAFQASRPDGLYEFNDVPMSYGLNLVKVVLYGPQGERQELDSKIETQNLVAAKGEFDYTFYAGKPFNSLKRASLQTAYGLSHDWNLLAGAAGVEFNDQNGTQDIAGSRTDHGYATAGLQGQVSGWGLQGMFSKDFNGGEAQLLSARTRLGAWTLGGTQVWLHDYISDEFQANNGQIKSRSMFDFSGSIPDLTAPILGIGGNLQLDTLVDGSTITRGHLYLGSSLGRWSVSNQLDAVKDSRYSGPTPIQGAFLISRGFTGFNLRGSAGYQLEPDGKLQTLALTADTNRFASWYLTSTAQYSVAAKDWAFYAGALKSQGRFSLGINVGHSTSAGWNAAVTFHIGLSRDTIRGGWLAQAQQATAQSLILGHAFLDGNRNGRYDEGEQGIPASFGMSGYGPSATAGQDGVGVMNGAPPWTDLRVGMTPPDGGDNSIYKPDVPVKRILSRPGRTTVVEFPVALMAEVNGTLFIQDGAAPAPRGGLHVELVDESGGVVQTARSAFDGYFEFKNVESGKRYTLRLKAEEAAAIGVRSGNSRQVAIAPDGGYFDGQDLILVVRPSSAVPVPPPTTAPAPPPPLLPPSPTPAQLQEAVLRGPAKQAAQLSKAWLAHTDLKGWAVRAQIGALPTTLLEAAEYLDPKDGAILLRPWALANGQCARQFFVAGFRTKAAAQRYASHLRVNKQLDPPTVVPVKDLVGAEPPCSFYAE